MSGVALAWRPESLPLALRLSGLRETDSVLGSQTEGAFGQVATRSMTAGAVSEFELADWRVRAEVEVGRAQPEVGGGVITAMGDVLTSGFAVHATKRIDRKNRVTLGLSQPMRAESVELAMSVPVGRTKEGRVVYADVESNVKPTGRQIDLSVSWERGTSATDRFMLEGVYRREAGHRAHSPAEFQWTAGWRRQF